MPIVSVDRTFYMNAQIAGSCWFCDKDLCAIEAKLLFFLQWLVRIANVWQKVRQRQYPPMFLLSARVECFIGAVLLDFSVQAELIFLLSDFIC